MLPIFEPTEEAGAEDGRQGTSSGKPIVGKEKLTAKKRQRVLYVDLRFLRVSLQDH